VTRARIRHDVVQGSAESLEQDRATVEIDAQQARAAIAVGKAQRGGFEGEIPPSPRNADLEDSRRPLGEHRLDDERRMATAQRGTDCQRPLLRQGLHDRGQLVEPRGVPVGDDLVPHLIGDVEHHVAPPMRRD